MTYFLLHLCTNHSRYTGVTRCLWWIHFCTLKETDFETKEDLRYSQSNELILSAVTYNEAVVLI